MDVHSVGGRRPDAPIGAAAAAPTDKTFGMIDKANLPIVIVSADLASAYAAAMLNRIAVTSGTRSVFNATQAVSRNPAMTPAKLLVVSSLFTPSSNEFLL